MPILIKGTYWDKKDAASVYEDTKLSVIKLMEMFDRKLTLLTCQMNDPFADDRFRKWLKDERENILAIFFLSSDIMCDEAVPLPMYIVSDIFRMNNVKDGLMIAKLDVFHANVTDYNTLMQEGSCSDGSAARAMFSGELLVAGRNQHELDTAIGFAKELQKIFENERLSDDLGFLIACDVARKAYVGKQELVEIPDNEMKRIALHSMKKRRVEPHVQKKLLPAIRKALTM